MAKTARNMGKALTHQFLEGGGKRQQGADPVVGDDLEPAGRRLQPQLRQTLMANLILVSYLDMLRLPLTTYFFRLFLQISSGEISYLILCLGRDGGEIDLARVKRCGRDALQLALGAPCSEHLNIKFIGIKFRERKGPL